MAQTFIALLTEQNTSEMKYGRNKGDIFYLKVLLTSNVTSGTQSMVKFLLFYLSSTLQRLLKTLLFLQGCLAVQLGRNHDVDGQRKQVQLTEFFFSPFLCIPSFCHLSPTYKLSV